MEPGSGASCSGVSEATVDEPFCAVNEPSLGRTNTINRSIDDGLSWRSESLAAVP